MAKNNAKLSPRAKRKITVSKKIKPTVDRPRLCVFRSNKHIYAQLLQGLDGKVVATASTLSKDLVASTAKLNKTDAAKKVGEVLGKLAKDKGVEKIVFDRGGYLYHGRVKAVADGLRAAGLNF